MHYMTNREDNKIVIYCENETEFDYWKGKIDKWFIKWTWGGKN